MYSVVYRRMWSVTLRAEPRLRIVVQKILRETLGHKKEEVTGGWKKPHTEGLNEFYVHSSPNNVREMKARRKQWVGRVVSIGEKKNSYRFLCTITLFKLVVPTCTVC